MARDVHATRVKRACRLMGEQGIDALLLAKPANMFYLTGDGRLCSFVMVSREGEVAMGVPTTDVEDVRRLARFDHIVGFENEIMMIHAISHFFGQFGIKSGRVGLEYTFLTQAMKGMLTHPHAKPEGVAEVDGTRIMSSLRMVKEEGEVARIRASARVAAEGMRAGVAAVRAGVTESMVAAEAERAMRRAGAEGFWRSYVSSGPRTNLAHGVATTRRLRRGELVMIDIHPVVDGYSADICRTVCVGPPSDAQRTAHALYLRAQRAAVEKARAGVTMDELEEALQGVIGEGGHADHVFGPPVHGVGIEFEEAPLPSGHAFFHGEEEAPPLAANTVIAVGNCGLYTGPWGVRVEDTVLIGPRGPTVLTRFPRALGPGR